MRQFLNSSSKASSSSTPSWTSRETEKAPYRFGGWNANGLGTRLTDKSNVDALEAFLNEQDLDVLCITETWLKRSSENMSYQVSEKDAAKHIVDRFRERLNNSSTSSGASSTNTAGYNWRFSCAEKKKAGTCVLISKRLSEPAIRYNMDHMSDSSPDNNTANRTNKHHEEGRVIVLQWPSILILMTYAPNNGITLESLDRRAKWDEQIACFLEFHRRCFRLNTKPVRQE
jgi:AP endonuclease 1